jgi:formylglycine-generating enzyme required for sulfatase activity
MHADCASDGCADDGRCAVGKSCTQNHGGRTCGKGEYNTPGAAHESCCTEIKVNRANSPFYLDKYLITAGRIRQFFERVNGDVKSFVKTQPKWVAAWTANMPSNMTEALANVGPVPLAWDWADGTGIQARGCQIAGGGARTYFQPSFGGDEFNHYPQEALDEKPINCINQPLLLAFCLWDGKDLPPTADLAYAWNGPTSRKYPWGNTPGLPTTKYDLSNTRLVHRYGYMYPATFLTPDDSFHLGAPGRRFAGAGPFGHFDLAGNVFPLARNGRISAGSWEQHVPTGEVTAHETWRRYYAFGGRCGHK